VTHSGADIAQLLSAHGLRPSRALGQNFVADPNTVRRIARLAGVGPGSDVLEIGAGLGSLTLALAETGARVVAVETDRHLIPVLRSVAEPAGAEVVEGDAMTLDLPALLAERGGDDWSLVANLPYNVATPLVLRTLVEVAAVRHLLVMVQREVGERMAAGAGDPAYGSVSVRIAYFARASVVGRVPASVFIPRPRVESVLVRMDRLAEPAVSPEIVSYERLAAVVKAGFGQRRKMLRRSLAGVVDPEAFALAGVRPDARAEELGVAEWGRLAAP
jgi:16S rRNA (adenine1518-N6/adenine1519-N6)-dimethyltransferase